MNDHFDAEEFTLEACRYSLEPFTMMVFEILHPQGSDPFLPNWHHDATCHHLEQVEQGEILRLIMEMPPRSLKSITTSVAYTAWLLGRNPAAKILVASYGAELAQKHAQDTSTVMNSPFYKKLFPNTRIKTDRALEITTSAGGVRKGVSLGGAVTGFGADVIIVDDLMKAADASSEAETQRVHEFYDGSLVSRLNNQETGRIIVIQQRLAEYDLVGYLKEKGNYEVLSLPAIAQCVEDIPLSRGRVHHREIGDLLFPQSQSQAVLDSLRREIGNAAFSAQYLQNPTPPGGNRIRWEWFGSYDFDPERSMFQKVVQSWDTGFSEEPTSSFSVCTTWGLLDKNWHLLDLVRGRYVYADLKHHAFALNRKWTPDFIIIERAASGHALLQDFRILGDPRIRICPITPKIDKALRLEAAAAELEEGNFLLPRNAPWLKALRLECMGFPRARHDDQVDSLSQFVHWQKMHKGTLAAVRVLVGRTWRRRLRPQLKNLS